MVKQDWLHLAEIVDSLRVFPRLVLAAYGFYVYHITNSVLLWYFKQPISERGINDSAMIGLIITAVTGFAPWIIQIYSSGGRNWDAGSSSTTTASTTVTTAATTPATP